MSEYFPTYNTKAQALKAEGEAAKGEWDRFRNSPASQDKLNALRRYFEVLKAEYTYRLNSWNNAWSSQDPGHLQWLGVLERDLYELERQDTIL
ncbi:hypothetical protein AX15_001521 [Amanita polypyramis BW_CC]|nr:hypothetical protein AX15_001521 [Amanita polypyramis BW_CC]